jgi:hypothetical protein
MFGDFVHFLIYLSCTSKKATKILPLLLFALY